jgi:hypothetical protein
MSESSVYIILQTKKALELTKGVYVTGCRSDCDAASHHNIIIVLVFSFFSVDDCDIDEMRPKQDRAEGFSLTTPGLALRFGDQID